MDSNIIKVVNNCLKAIEVFLRYKRPKRGKDPRPKSFSLKPGQESRPLPKRLLVGANGWEALRRRDCIQVQAVAFDPRYIQVLNESSESISLTLRIKRPKKPRRLKRLMIKPKTTSRIFDLKSIREPRKLKTLVAQKKISVVPIFKIGPAAKGEKSSGWYDGENVYTCYDCGGPITFRGSPPRPVHI